MAREIDSKTGKYIVEISSKKGFVNAVVHNTPVIRATGEFTNDCFDRMSKSKKLAKAGKIVLIGESIPLFEIVSVIDVLAMDIPIGLGAIGMSPAVFAAVTVFGVAGVSAIIDGRKFKKYEAELVSENEIIFRMKKLIK